MKTVKKYRFYDFETSLEDYQLHKLNQMLAFIVRQNEFYKEKLTNISIPIQSKNDLASLPFTTKEELIKDQQDYPPFGRNHSYPLQYYNRFHQTSGTSGRPLKILDTKTSWQWWENCWLEVLKSSKVQETDRVFLAFSFGPFVGFWGGFEAAKKLGALVITSGSQTSKDRLQTIVELEATVLLCTPSYALHLVEIAKELNLDLKKTAIQKIITAGEPGGSIPSIRKRIEEAWSAKVFDHVGMTEMGAYGYSCEMQNGLHINESEFIAEIINPDTLEPVDPGDTGELVLTNLGRYGYPLIRYRTGDLVKFDPTPCPCGNTYTFLPGGLIGRKDDMVVIRGINIFPSSIESIIREFDEILEFRIVYYTIDNMDQIKVQIETREPSLKETLATLLRQRIGLRIQVEVVERLPRFELKGRRVLDLRNHVRVV